jgi:nucleoside-diphosphate-sugar epimerase
MSTESTELITIGITGATGLVGRALVAQLSKTFAVVAIGRDSSALTKLLASCEHEAISKPVARIADVCDRQALEQAFVGLDIIVHAAGFVDPMADRQLILSINTGGTANALEAADKAGVKQFIHISSLSVITGQGDQFNLDESAPLQLCGEAYADSKVEAEKLFDRSNFSYKFAYTILRPGFIYGPGERSWLPRVSKAIASGQAMLVDGGTRETNVVYVGNLVQAVRAAILNEKAYGQVFNITDGEKVSKKQLFDAIADGIGMPRVKKDLPRWLVKPVCQLVTAATANKKMTAESQAKLARFSPAAFRLAAVNQGFSIAKAERILDYNSSKRISFKDGMDITMKSIKAEALVEKHNKEE